MGHFLPRTPINHRAKFDAASFILAGEIVTVQTKKNKNYKHKTVYSHFAYRHEWIMRSALYMSDESKSIVTSLGLSGLRNGDKQDSGASLSLFLLTFTRSWVRLM